MVALQEAWRQGVRSPRSPKKLDTLHGWIREELLRGLPDFKVYSKSTESGEFNRERPVEGKYYRKLVDVVVSRQYRDLGVISVKLIQSSYKKNAINYFEHQLGETANLRRQQLLYGNVIFMPHPIPVKKGSEWGEEHITDAALDRYRKLVQDHDNSVVPDVQAIVIACLDQNRNELTRLATRADLGHLGTKSLDFLFGRVHIAKFVRDYTEQIKVTYQRLME